jgi:hypothetical protein
VGKVNLPVFSRYRALELVGHEGGGWFETTLRRDLGTGGAFLGNLIYKGGKSGVEE